MAGRGSNRHQELPRCYQQSTQHRRPGRAGGGWEARGLGAGPEPPTLVHTGAGHRGGPGAGDPHGRVQWGWALGAPGVYVSQHSEVRPWGALGMVLPPSTAGPGSRGTPTPTSLHPLLLARPRDGCWGRGMWGVVPGCLLATGLLATPPPGPVAWQRPRGDEWPSIPNEMGGGRGGRTPSTQGSSLYTLHCPGGA